MPVSPNGKNDHRAVCELVSGLILRCVYHTVSPFAHPTRDRVAEQQGVFARPVESAVESWCQVVSVRAHLSAQLCERHGCGELRLERMYE